MSRVHPQNHQRRQGHESRGGRGSTESDCPTALSPGEEKVSAWCGTGEKGGYRDFPPSLRTLPFGRRQVRAASCILELREVACCRVDFPLCVSPLPAPPPRHPYPRSPSAPFTSSAPADAGQGCQTASRRGGAGFCPVLLFLELSLWDFNDSSATHNLLHPASDCLHPGVNPYHNSLFGWPLVT